MNRHKAAGAIHYQMTYIFDVLWVQRPRQGSLPPMDQIILCTLGMNGGTQRHHLLVEVKTGHTRCLESDHLIRCSECYFAQRAVFFHFLQANQKNRNNQWLYRLSGITQQKVKSKTNSASSATLR